MKKIISICLLILFLSSNLSFAATCENLTNCLNNQCKTVAGEEQCTSIAPTTNTESCDPACSDTQKCVSNTCTAMTQAELDQARCGGNGTYNGTTKTCDVGNVPVTNSNQTPTDTTVNGITIGQKCLLNGQCKFNIYDTLGIRSSIRDTGESTSVGLFVQDIVLSATFFIGTIVTIALLISGIMFIFAAAGGNDSLATSAKKGITGALIGLVIVACSYLIIRLVQYLAKGF